VHATLLAQQQQPGIPAAQQGKLSQQEAKAYLNRLQTSSCGGKGLNKSFPVC